MTEPDAGDLTAPPGPDREMEQRIPALMEQEHETSPDFVDRVRGKIYRRTVTSQLASYSWHLPKMILIELASLLNHLFRAFGTKKEPEP